MWYSENERHHFIDCSKSVYFFKIVTEIGCLLAFIGGFFSLFHVFRCCLTRMPLNVWGGQFFFWLVLGFAFILLNKLCWKLIVKFGFNFDYVHDRPEKKGLHASDAEEEIKSSTPA
jgi:hypothetical protein